MFSNTAYEAMYSYLGLALHAKFIEVITSQKIFIGVISLIFGFMFFMTSVEFFSRYLPGALVRRRNVPLSNYVKIVACLFLGIAFLKVGSHTQVKRFNGESWDTNSYVRSKVRGVTPEYKVSFVFDILSRSAEEIAALVGRIVDNVFQSANSQLDAPDFFFKAMMYAGASSIDDPALKKSVQFYTEECFDRVLPFIAKASKESRLDRMYADSASVDQKLADVYIDRPDKKPYNCLDVKNEVRDQLKQYAWAKNEAGGFIDKAATYLKIPDVYKALTNYQASSLLVNNYMDSQEGMMGIQKGSQLPTTAGRVAQYFNRAMSWDGLLSIVGMKDYQGASLAASRSQEFSENLARAPHVAGFLKMLIVASFPWLLFFVVAGYWRVLIYWFLIYLSVLMWTPIWTLLYHIMVGISMSSEVMDSFGRLNDGVSLYSAQIISSRIYHLYAVYSWLQLLTGTLFTGMLLFFIRPALNDTQSDSAPSGFDSAQDSAGKAGKVASLAGRVL